jgi:hypothetical protein
VDRGRDATCCRSADPEIVESEPHAFDCETCEFRCQVDGLDPENAEAWRVYSRLTSHRWVWETQCGPWWVGEVFRDFDDSDERDTMMARVSVIYDTLHPPKAKPHGA